MIFVIRVTEGRLHLIYLLVAADEVFTMDGDVFTIRMIVSEFEELVKDTPIKYEREKDTYCTECDQPCEVVERDFGIGAYEYWGAPGYDERICSVSECCEADYEER